MAKLDLTPEDLLAVARACRIAVAQAEKDLAAQQDSSLRTVFEGVAKKYRDLAEMFDSVHRAEAARRGLANSCKTPDAPRQLVRFVLS